MVSFSLFCLFGKENDVLTGKKLPVWGNAVIENDVQTVSKALKIPDARGVVLANYEGSSAESAEANAVLLAYIDLIRKMADAAAAIDMQEAVKAETKINGDKKSKNDILKKISMSTCTIEPYNLGYNLNTTLEIEKESLGIEYNICFAILDFMYSCDKKETLPFITTSSDITSPEVEHAMNLSIANAIKHTENADVSIKKMNYETRKMESVLPENLTMEDLDSIIFNFSKYYKSLQFHSEKIFILNKSGKYNALVVYSYDKDAYGKAIKRLQKEDYINPYIFFNDNDLRETIKSTLLKKQGFDNNESFDNDESYEYDFE